MNKTITIPNELEERLVYTMMTIELYHWVYESYEPWEWSEDIKAVTDFLSLLGYDMTEYIDDYEDRLKEDAEEVAEYEQSVNYSVHIR